MFKIITLAILSCTFYLSALPVICIKPTQAVNDRGQIIKNIAVNDIISVSHHPRHKEYYLVGKSTLLVSKIDFHDLDQATTYFEKLKLKLENDFTLQQTRLQQINSDINSIERQILETERDTALSYRNSTRSYSGIASFTYSGFISSTKARKLKEKLTVDYETLAKEKNNLRKQSIITLSKRVGIDHNFEQTQKSLSQLAPPDNSYFTNRDQVPLYINGQVGKHLNAFVKLKARSHPKHKNWHQVIVDKKIYDTPSENITKTSALKSLYATRSTQNLTRMKHMEEEIKDQAFSILLLQAVARQLNTDRFLSGGYGIVKNITVKIDPDTNFTIHTGNNDSVYVHRSRAEQVLLIWKQRLDNKKSYLTLLQNELLKLKQNERNIKSEESQALSLLK